ncbi:MAG: nuclear transport factor 2 family protein [Iphinoe sp. HA4291-MV1]|jgi:predicted ester cyclase|nr:nuclear transport factor 2 family protein [Iphinoe sp. HA4291-MV1]
MRKTFQVAIVLVLALTLLSANVSADQTTDLQNITAQTSVPNNSQNNFDAREFADGYFQLWNNQAIDKAGDYYAKKVHYRDLSLGVSLKGIEAVKKFMKEQFEGTPDLKFKTIDVVVQSPEKIAIQWLMTGTDQGKLSQTEGVSVMELRQGKIIKNTDYYK